MDNVLLTDSLTLVVRYGEREAEVTVVYGDFFKKVYDACIELFGIDAQEAAQYALFQENGTRLPKPARIYDNAEISDRSIVELRRR